MLRLIIARISIFFWILTLKVDCHEPIQTLVSIFNFFRKNHVKEIKNKISNFENCFYIRVYIYVCIKINAGFTPEYKYYTIFFIVKYFKRFKYMNEVVIAWFVFLLWFVVHGIKMGIVYIIWFIDLKLGFIRWGKALTLNISFNIRLSYKYSMRNIRYLL